MAQFNWLYLGENGRRYNVGLFHGDSTGHLMVLCNTKIVLIDFSVKQTKDYSFFIDDELFELSVKGIPGGRYAYDCSINEEADTPRNRVRKKQKKIDFRKMVAMIAVFVLIIIGVLGFAAASQKDPPPPDPNVLLSQLGQQSVARIFLDNSGKKIRYSFVADGQVKEFEEELPSEAINGFPLADGDEFAIRYVVNRPQLHELEYDQPTSKQLSRYQERTFQKHRQLHPELNRTQAKCQVDIAYRLGGVEALAVLYNQDISSEEDAAYNQQLYQKFTRDIPFQEAVERECWE